MNELHELHEDLDLDDCAGCHNAFHPTDNKVDVAETIRCGEYIEVAYTEMHVGCAMKAALENRNLTLANAPF
jgi:hypothetical protein